VSKTSVVDFSTLGWRLSLRSDPLPFQFWHRYPSLTQGATFVDVDYPQLMEKKRDRMLSNGLLRDALFRTKLRVSEPPVYLRSDGYMALGCDLKDIGTLERLLRAEFDIPSASVLFVAEVSVTYMPVKDADALIQWASTLEDGMSAGPTAMIDGY
jgi:tRNA wybutosine-synthesizing protein 4